MIIHSEQEMLTFGENFAEELTSAGDAGISLGGWPSLGDPHGAPSRRGGKCEDRTRPKENPAGPGNIVIELIGDVGAGKTTFVRGLAKGLGITEPITSPSFTISKQYALPDGRRLIHYDFYRLPDPGLMSEDLQESVSDPHTITVIEWSDSVSNLLPEHRIQIKIRYNDDSTRSIEPIFS